MLSRPPNHALPYTVRVALIKQRWPTLTHDLPLCATTACMPVVCGSQSYTGSSGGASSSRTASGGSPTDPEGHYRVLGVSPSSSTQEVQAAFRAAALKWHPDRCAWTMALRFAALDFGEHLRMSHV